MIRSAYPPDVVDYSGILTQTIVEPEQPTLNLIADLCQALAEEHISYCHWKSNNALDRSANGKNDLDFLVSRADGSRFTEILGRLGFRQAQGPAEKALPGVVDYYGFDPAADRLIHVHAHYQLILGHDMTKNYRLPIEAPYLKSAVQAELFRVPSADYEYIGLIIRMVLKHSTWDAILSRQGALKKAELQEIAYLQERIDPDCVRTILAQHLPYIGVELFDDCIQALQTDCSFWDRATTGRRLQARLRPNSRRPMVAALFLKLWRRTVLAIQRRVFKTSPKYRLGSGGAMIAIVGGDGAGKSTAVDALQTWLSKDLATTTVHMGKPAWSLMTISVRSILKAGSLLGLYPGASSDRETLNQKSPVSPGYPWLLREVCRARDRYWTYAKARRFASAGGLVILDRFPLSQIQLMDGPLAVHYMNQLQGRQDNQLLAPKPSSPLAKALVAREESYYLEIAPPDMLIVLLVDPEIAVQRKTDETPASVRERSTEVWRLNWAQTDAHVVDASKSGNDVLNELKVHIWSNL